MSSGFNPKLLFAIAVGIWGTTWIAITYQLPGAAVEVSVALRFALAAGILLAGCVLWRLPLRFTPQQHAALALQGLLSYNLAYVLVYQAERFVVSGLVAIGYAASPLINLVLMRCFFGTPISARIAAGGALGLAGVVAVYGQQFSAARFGAQAGWGALFTAASVLVSALGVMCVVNQQRTGLRGWPPMAVAMGYGAASTALVAMVLQRPWSIAWTPAFTWSLIFLSICGSIIAFGAYFALMDKVGAARSGYVGVMVPIVALTVSSLFEQLAWHPIAVIGVAMAVAGNLLTLRTGGTKEPAEPVAVGSSR